MARIPRVTMERSGEGQGIEPVRTEDTLSDARASDRPTLEDIAAEAYAIYLADGAQDGHDLDHWLEAERRIIAKAQGSRHPATDLQQEARERQQDDGNEHMLEDRNAATL